MCVNLFSTPVSIIRTKKTRQPKPGGDHPHATTKAKTGHWTLFFNNNTLYFFYWCFFFYLFLRDLCSLSMELMSLWLQHRKWCTWYVLALVRLSCENTATRQHGGQKLAMLANINVAVSISKPLRLTIYEVAVQMLNNLKPNLKQYCLSG